MSERLQDLPPVNTVMNQDEVAIMNGMFGASAPAQGGSLLSYTKAAIYATILFLALANPWVDPLFEKIPYCGDNPIFVLGIKAVIFFIGILILRRFT